eukprot:TRINITY_DN511_c0_g1_i3.p3 TRINITY_DN511_c0_g1~~TRINITY_DN511_c0_g1_i3.p3  ORF type:complete len:289 (+),score=66.45 TRINITY_DN511_c0_g1_i3:915-1781(+)
MSISPGPLRDYQPLASPLLTPAPFAQSPRMWPGPTGMARTSPLPGASFMGNLLTPRAPVTLDSFAEPTKPPLAPGPRGASASASAAAFDQLQAQQQQQQQHLSPAPFAPFPLSANLSSLFFMSRPPYNAWDMSYPPPMPYGMERLPMPPPPYAPAIPPVVPPALAYNSQALMPLPTVLAAQRRAIVKLRRQQRQATGGLAPATTASGDLCLHSNDESGRGCGGSGAGLSDSGNGTPGSGSGSTNSKNKNGVADAAAAVVTSPAQSGATGLRAGHGSPVPASGAVPPLR